MNSFLTIGRLTGGAPSYTPEPQEPQPEPTRDIPVPHERTLRTTKGLVVTTTMTDAEAASIIANHPREDEFADSLLTDYNRFAGLTPNKMAWFHQKALDFLAKEFGTDTAAPAKVASHNYIRLFELFQLATKLQYPTVTINLGNRRLQLVYKRDGKYPNTISVSSGPRAVGGKWFGSIKSDGEFYCKFPMPEDLLEILMRLKDDPSGVLAELGRKTGRCCYCDIVLTDEVSTAFGYGATCAKHYGQPHSKTEALKLGLMK